MLKKTLVSLALAVCCATPALAAPMQVPAAQQAKGAVVIDGGSGRVLYEKDCDARLPMASTTKIMTALLTLEQPDLDGAFPVDRNAIRVEGSSMGLREGDTVTLRTLAYGMLLPSGNDAANAAAVRIAGTKEAFVRLMNERAAELGLENTHFMTPSGLDEDTHYSSARDMAMLAREALANPAFAEICGKSSAKVQFGNPPYDRWLTNHNKLLKYYPGVTGVKTGFTGRAGRCLVSSAQRDGVELIAVTLGCPDDWNVHMRLYDACFAKARRQTVALPALALPVAGAGAVSTVWSGNEATLLEGEEAEVLVTAEHFLFAPVEAGRVVGKAAVRAGEETVAEFDLVAAESASLPEPETWWQKLTS